MTEIVNLNQFRKNKRRAEKQQTAQNNRVKFGRTKAEREASKAAKAARDKELDGKKTNRDTKD